MVSLYSTWWLKPEFAHKMQAEFDKLVYKVNHLEPDTIMYNVHTPRFDFPKVDPGKNPIISEPMVRPGTIIFFEKYRSWDAFKAHLYGDTFRTFFKEHKDKFVSGYAGLPFIQVVFMDEIGGFDREAE